MPSVRTPALLVAVLLPLGAAWGAPRSLEVRASLTESSRAVRWADRALRPLPTALLRPGAYALVQRWVADLATPPQDGTPRVLVVPVRGGLGLVWARRW
ncbi:MAG: hypothetical protein ACXWK8_05820 [Myxococcaceae bacterium]